MILRVYLLALTRCRTTPLKFSEFKIAEALWDAANNRKLGDKLQLLREHTGADSIREQQAEDDARDFEFWATHIATDWDFSDS